MITVLGSRRHTKYFRFIPGFHIYGLDEAWTWEKNQDFIRTRFNKGDWFLVLRGGGPTFIEELKYLAELSRNRNERLEYGNNRNISN